MTTLTEQIKNKAIQEYREYAEEAQSLAFRISQYVDDYGEISPYDVGGADLEKMKFLCKELHKLTDFIDGKGE
jgi:hypothetical protein